MSERYLIATKDTVLYGKNKLLKDQARMSDGGGGSCGEGSKL